MILFASTAAARAQAPFTADTLIARYYVAIGGERQLLAISTRRMRGTYHEGKLDATTDILWNRTPERRVNVHAPGFDYSEGWNGSTWEYDHLSKRAIRDTGAAARAGERGAEFDESFVGYLSKGNHVELVGLDTLGGRTVWRLRVALRDGWVKEYYFDAGSYMLVALRKAMPIHATGAAVETLSFYEDWRRSCGILQAHRSVERRVDSGAVLSELRWESIECNVALRSAELDPP